MAQMQKQSTSRQPTIKGRLNLNGQAISARSSKMLDKSVANLKKGFASMPIIRADIGSFKPANLQ
jgi:hypothetical protein